MAKTTTLPTPAKQTQIATIKQVLFANREKIEKALPEHIKADRMIRVTLNCISRDANLMNCTAESVYTAVVEASTYGWEIGGPVAEAYLVPFKDGRRGTTEAQLIPGYRGLLNLARNSGTVSSIIRGVVREGDKFRYMPTAEPPIFHEPTLSPERSNMPITHAYVMAKLRDGGYQPLVMTYQDIAAHRDRFSKSYQWAETGDPKKGGGKKDSAWHIHPDIMCGKTVIRAFLMHGHVAMSAEMRALVGRENVIEGAADDVIASTSVSPTDDTSSPPVLTVAMPLIETDAIDPDEADKLMMQFEEMLSAAETKTAVTKGVTAFDGEWPNDDLRKVADEKAESRLAEIASSRGERSNK